MYAKFNKLSRERREVIINAALMEFAAKGYKDASTNRIIEGADISKGSLFHYFKNKKQLFIYLLDFSIEKIVSEIKIRVDFAEKDLFKRIRQMVDIELELSQIYPTIFQFVEAAYFEQSVEVMHELEERKESALFTKKLFDDIDTSLFKKGIDATQAIKVIWWSLDGLGREISKAHEHNRQIDYEQATQETEQLLQFLTETFYQEGSSLA